MNERADETIAAWRGRRVAVIGMARSGRAVARLLAGHGAVVRGTDLREASALDLDVATLSREGIDLRLGGHDPSDLDDAVVVVVSPGIPKTVPILVEARRRGLPLLSELEVAARFAGAPLAAVTGTNGKSTTVTVLGELVAALGRPVAVAGNVGVALSEVVEGVPADGFLVVEVSSFQLEDVERFHPRTAAVLNLAPDHMDRYDSFDDYVAAKARIFARQEAGDTAVLPEADPRLDRLAPSLAARVLRFGDEPAGGDGVFFDGRSLGWRAAGVRTVIAPADEIALPGPHNRENVAAALCLLAGLGLDPLDPRIRGALGRLRGLPHRIERVGEIEGVVFYNDSKATNPESLEVALRSFPEGAALIAGGRAKGGDYARLAPLLARHARVVVLIGEAAADLRAAWAGAGVEMVDGGSDFEAAVRLGWERARALGVPLLLSPGCASFDMFRDYEERGDRFRDLARAGEDRP